MTVFITPGDGFYGHAAAGQVAYGLFEELAGMTGRSGHVELHRTLHSEYPPVYSVIYVPNHWDTVTADQCAQLFALAEKYGAECKFKGRDASFIAVFGPGPGGRCDA